MALAAPRRPASRVLAPGDVLILLSMASTKVPSGGPAVRRRPRRSIVARHRDEPMAALSARLLDAVLAFTDSAPQDDDITTVLLKRESVR